MTASDEDLAKKIEAYWRSQGHVVKVSVGGPYGIQSNLKRGLPLDIKPESDLVLQKGEAAETYARPAPPQEEKRRDARGRKPQHNFSKDDLKRIEDMWLQPGKYTVQQISDRFGLSIPYLYQLRAKQKWPLRGSIDLPTDGAGADNANLDANADEAHQQPD